ncbi:hypothetical protein RZS08_00370, partial [Arthrospira platensis SPKY1]|nr:hypothetical protein [Arthrospira platensis SPKY1]
EQSIFLGQSQEEAQALQPPTQLEEGGEPNKTGAQSATTEATKVETPPPALVEKPTPKPQPATPPVVRQANIRDLVSGRAALQAPTEAFVGQTVPFELLFEGDTPVFWEDDAGIRAGGKRVER